jgi:hypothetical protein
MGVLIKSFIFNESARDSGFGPHVKKKIVSRRG